jgi:hypothetical protein
MMESPGPAAVEENPALPIAPIVAAGTSVAAALKQAQVWSARAVVELAEKVVRIHAAAALRSADERGDGWLPLDRLPAIEVGRRRLEAPATLVEGVVVGLGIGFAPPDNLTYRASIMAIESPIFGEIIAGTVARAYKCPTDGEKFNRSGKCDLHYVDLVPDDGT